MEVQTKRKNNKLHKMKLTKDYEESLPNFKFLLNSATNKAESTPLSNSSSNLNSNSNYSSNAYEEVEEDSGKRERRNKFLQTQTEMEINNSLIDERNKGIQEIEKQVVQVHEIFTDLAKLVDEQGEMIDSIESNVENSVEHVKHGVQEISKASDYQKSYRGKLCFLVLLILFIVGAAVITIYLLTR